MDEQFGGRSPQLPASKISITIKAIGTLVLLALIVLLYLHKISVGESVHWLDTLLASFGIVLFMFSAASTMGEIKQYQEEKSKPPTPYAV